MNILTAHPPLTLVSFIGCGVLWCSRWMPTSAISPKLPELLLKLEFSRDMLSRFDFPGVVLRASAVGW